jgi:hypothetical protein
MSLTLDGTASARIEAAVRGVAWLADLDFGTGSVYFTTAPVSVVANGHTYLGLGSLVDVSVLGESEDSNAEKIVLSFTLVDTAMLAATLGNVANYRGLRARLWLQLFDEQFQPAGAPVQRWGGFMDRVATERKPAPATGGPGAGHIRLECSRAGMSRARNTTGLRLTDAQQQQRYPADVGLAFMQTLIEQPSLWLSKRFQQQ